MLCYDGSYKSLCFRTYCGYYDVRQGSAPVALEASDRLDLSHSGWGLVAYIYYLYMPALLIEESHGFCVTILCMFGSLCFVSEMFECIV